MSLSCPAQAQDREERADRHPGVSLRERGESDADSSQYTDTDYSDSEAESQAAAGDVPVTREASGNEPDVRRRGGPGSIASTYWRPERTDRKNLLTVVDEQCACCLPHRAVHGTEALPLLQLKEDAAAACFQGAGPDVLAWWGCSRCAGGSGWVIEYRKPRIPTADHSPPPQRHAILKQVQQCWRFIQSATSACVKPSVTCRFEQLALGYDEDDIGSLADDDPDIAGDTAVDDFSDALVILKPLAGNVDRKLSVFVFNAADTSLHCPS